MLIQTSMLVNQWVEEQSPQITLEDLAAIRHESIAPCKDGSGSGDRTKFCENIVSKADEIAGDLIRRQEWRYAFYDDRGSRVRLALEANRAIATLKDEAK